MKLKGFLLIVVLLAGGASARAADSKSKPNVKANGFSSAGCGLGSILFEGKKGKAQLILAVTFNAAGSQTFGISSETEGCTSEGLVTSNKRLEVYAAVNFQKLSREMAQGGGEFLAGLSTLMGCKDEAQKKAFMSLAQRRYEAILPTETTDSTAMINNLKSEMGKDPVLRTL